MPNREGIPDWFEHQIRGDTISFWFRKKIPSITCIFLIPGSVQLPEFNLVVNDRETTLNDCLLYYDNDDEVLPSERAYLFDLNLDQHIYDGFQNEPELYEAFKSNEWNYVELKWKIYYWSDTEEEGFSDTEDDFSAQFIMGIHVLKERSNTEEDVIFTNPYGKKTKSDEYLNASLHQKELMKEEERNTWGTLLGLGASNSNTNGDEIEISSSAQMDEGVGDLIFADSSLPQKISKQDETKMWGTFLGLGAS